MHYEMKGQSDVPLVISHNTLRQAEITRVTILLFSLKGNTSKSMQASRKNNKGKHKQQNHPEYYKLKTEKKN
jgi:hypothetical protein